MLTKDEIDALMPKPYRASGQQMSYDGYDKAHCHLFSIGQVHSVVSDAIAAHTAKVLEDVEPVAWGIFAMNGNIRFWSCDKASADAQAAKTGGEVVGIYPAHTVAALAARVAELEGVIDSVLLDIDDDGVAEAQDIAILAMRNIRNGRPQYEGLDAALAAKGQA